MRKSKVHRCTVLPSFQESQNQMIHFKKHLQQAYRLSEQEWDQFNEHFALQHVSRGTFFIRQGSICRSMAFIEEGVMRYLRFEENGEETTCYFQSENEFVGDPDSFFDRKPSQLNATAITDCTVVTFSFEDFQFLKQYPRFMEVLTQINSDVMKGLLQQRDFLLNKDAASKYKEFMERYPQLFQRVPLGIIASYLGITQQSLSRLRKQLA